MKRFFSYVAMMVVALVAFSCEKGPEPVSVDFSKDLYTVYENGSVQIDLVLGEAAVEDVTVPLNFSGKAVKGTDYTVSSEAVLIKAGENTGVFTLSNKSLSADKQVSVSFVAPEGYKPGNKINAVIAASNEEALIYQFESEKANLHEAVLVKVKLTGTKSGKDFKATEALKLPLSYSGEGASLIAPAEIVVKAGENEGHALLKIADPAFNKKSVAVVSVDRGLASRFIPSDEKAEEVVTVWGKMTPERLAGTWEFVKVYDKDELDLWFMEMEDDPSLLPTKNEGFQFTIAGNELTPNNQGDWAAFFRKCTLSLAQPANTCANAVALGANTAEELNMFMQEEGYTYVQTTYFGLSNANRAFDAESETLGKALICISMIDENTIQVQLRDYDAPPFSIMWWDDEKFDGEMFGFASEFKKVK